MASQTCSPDPSAKRIKLDSPARDLADLTAHPFYPPLGHYNSPGPIYHGTPLPDNTSNVADVELQVKVAQLEREKAQFERESLALRIELEKLKATKANANATPGPHENAPLENGASQSQAPANGAMPNIDPEVRLFRERIASIEPLKKKLTGCAGYRQWAEEILSRARAADCHTLLENEEEACPAHLDQRGKTLWWLKNDWLYDLICKSCREDVTSSMYAPRNHHAFTLWRTLRHRFWRSLQEERREILLKVLYTDHSPDDTKNCRQIRDWAETLRTLDSTLPDWLVVDVAILALPHAVQDVMRDKLRDHVLVHGPSVPYTMDNLIEELSKENRHRPPGSLSLPPRPHQPQLPLPVSAPPAPGSSQPPTHWYSKQDALHPEQQNPPWLPQYQEGETPYQLAIPSGPSIKMEEHPPRRRTRGRGGRGKAKPSVCPQYKPKKKPRKAK